jgi:hypothetical protein
MVLHRLAYVALWRETAGMSWSCRSRRLLESPTVCWDVRREKTRPPRAHRIVERSTTAANSMDGLETGRTEPHLKTPAGLGG